jgi:hypothetical protein
MGNKEEEEERESVFKVVHVLVSGYILFQEENNKIWVVIYFCLIIEKEREREMKTCVNLLEVITVFS